MRLADYERLGGHMDRVRTVEDVMKNERVRMVEWDGLNPWPVSKIVKGEGVKGEQ